MPKGNRICVIIPPLLHLIKKSLIGCSKKMLRRNKANKSIIRSAFTFTTNSRPNKCY